jgi:hypothetical protein
LNTRSIVTSHPDVQCSFCGRRLLRGEQPDAFFVAGERRIVCELCGPRAAQEGWLRETHAASQPEHVPERPQRARSLWERFKQLQQGNRSASSSPARGRVRPPRSGPDEASSPPAPEAFDFSEPSAAPDAGEQPGFANGAVDEHPPDDPGSDTVEDHTVFLLAAFNASEHAERVASIARLLGPPLVCVRPAPGRDESLWITIAWEICWQRYEVDPDDPEGPHRIAEGMELDELSPEERTPNALADEQGRLHPAPA